MKKSIAWIAIVLIVWMSASLGLADSLFSYEITDAIPQSVQKEAIRIYLDSETGILTKPTMNYAELLEDYLKLYGIYVPESTRNNASVVWVQNKLLESENRITYIPERYIRDSELSDWVERYAEPGDLLLYRASGIPDKCIIYAGGGKVIGRYNSENRLLPVRATYVTGESFRTRSGGLFAIAHMWSDEEIEKVEEENIDVFIEKPTDSYSFTGEQYILFELNPNDNKYVKSENYIVYEYKPGIYRIWDGETFGFPLEYIEEHNGINIQLELSGNNTQIAKRIKLTISKDEIDMQDKRVRFVIQNNEANNQIQWNGIDLLLSLKEKSKEEDQQ